MKRIIFITILFCNTTLYGQNDTLKYIFMGHTYGYYDVNNPLDSRIGMINLNEYYGIWLGGDVCSESLMEYSTLEIIDDVFNLQNPNTHWALGNHDARNGNWVWLEELTGHKTFYTTHNKGITYLILNTNLTPYDCEQLDDQYRMIVNVCDTIKNSSHLVILMHHGVWHDVPGLPPPITYAQSNLRFYNFNCYSEKSTFLNEIYPRLVEVKNRGVEVISILGDMGAKKIELVSDDGLLFMGTGLRKSYYTDPVERENSPPDYAIIFKHVPQSGYLNWEFVNFDELSDYEY